MVAECPSTNAFITDQSDFWDMSGIHWDKHRIGWAVSGGAAALTVLITLYSVVMHGRNFHNPAEQRQILRILYMPPVFAVVAFLSYRFFRSYTYYSLIPVVYESVTLSAFLLLLIEYVASTATGHSAEMALQRKEKQALPFPFCFWRYRPTKPYFMHTLKWSVLQYVIIRPACSIAGIVCQALGVLCVQSYSPHFAEVYLMAVDFVSISVALYGLILFYALTKSELRGRRPFAKFITIKGIVAVTFYQEFMFGLFEKYHVIKGTEFWTATNVTNGLSALCTSIEMVIFSAFMIWAYPVKEYRGSTEPRTSVFKAIIHSLNFADFVVEILHSLKFFIDYARGKPETHSIPKNLDSTPSLSSSQRRRRPNFDEAFGLHSHQGSDFHRVRSNDSRVNVLSPEHHQQGQGQSDGYALSEMRAVDRRELNEGV